MSICLLSTLKFIPTFVTGLPERAKLQLSDKLTVE